MPRRLITLAFLLGVGIEAAFAQPNSGCPTVNVMGPAGIVEAGQKARYSAHVEPIDQSWTLEYKWTLSEGTIDSGQGTSQIEVIQPDASLTVTVEIRGLPSGCPAVASELASGGDRVHMAKNLGSVSGPITRRNIARIRSLLSEFQDDQYVQFWFIIAGKDDQTQAKKLNALKRLMQEAPERATYVLSDKTDDKLVVWAVPPGATPPEP